MTSWEEALDHAVEERAELMVSVRRHLHAYPEVSGEEFETTRYLARVLEEAGLPARPGPEGRGLVVEPAGAPPAGERIALRADLDALRIQESRESPHSSRRPGVMHACGHDGHTATVLGALLGLDAAARTGALPWPVPWRGLFQAAEETGRGAREMVEAGALEGVGAILGLHMDPSRAVGRIGLRAGVLTAACDELRVTIDGRGGHAARPHQSRDPIAAAAQLISTIYLFMPRSVDSHDPVVVTFGQVLAGDNPNVIPERALLGGTVRSLNAATRTAAEQHIRQLARGVAEISGTRIRVDVEPVPPSVRNDPEMIRLLRQAAVRALGEQSIDEIPSPSMGGEDFAYYLDHVPGAMFRLGCASPEVGSVSLHSPEFDLDERALAAGARVMARAAVLWADPGRTRREIA